MSETQDDLLRDKMQVLANAIELLAEAQAASHFAIKFAKTSLEGADPRVLESSGPKVAIVTLGLEALQRGTEGVAVVAQLTSYVMSLKKEIQEECARREGPKDNG